MIIAIITYNSEEHVQKLLESIIAQKVMSLSIFVIDNGSTDSTIAILKTYQKNTTLNLRIKTQTNVGFAKAANQVIESFNEPVYLINPDTVLEGNSIRRLRKYAKNTQKCLTSANIQNMNIFPKIGNNYVLNYDISKGRITGTNYTKNLGEPGFVPGTAVLLNCVLLKKNKLFFDETFFMYHEDVDLSLRASKLIPGSLGMMDDVIIWHQNEGSYSNRQTCNFAIKNIYTLMLKQMGMRYYFTHTYQYLREQVKGYGYYKKYYPIYYPYCCLKYAFLTPVLRFDLAFKRIDKALPSGVGTNNLQKDDISFIL